MTQSQHVNKKGVLTPMSTPDKQTDLEAGHAKEKYTTPANSSAMLARALWWLRQGVQLVPIQPRSKILIAGFGPYRAHVADEESARLWFLRRSCNLGVVCGSDLLCLDFDDSGAFTVWLDAGGRPLAERTLVEKSSRGYHVWFRIGGKVASAQGKLCEVKARGAVVMSAPSLSPAGYAYRVLRDAEPLRVDEKKLLPLLSIILPPSPPAAVANPRTLTPAKETIRDGSLINRIKRAWPIFDVAHEAVAQAGHALRPTDGGAGRWWSGCCPFHDDQHPSFWIDTERGTWGCRAGSCTARRGGDVIDLYARAHGITTRTAIAEMIWRLK